MKKALITIAVIFLISSVVCLSTGVALGARMVRNYSQRGGIAGTIEHLINSVEDTVKKHFPDAYFDKDIPDWNETDDSFDTEDGREVYSESASLTLEAGQKMLTVDAEAAELKLVTTEDEDFSATLKVFSDRADDVEGRFVLSENENGFSLKNNGIEGSDINAVLTVKVPKSYSGALDIKLAAGEVKVEDIALDALNINVAAGEVKLKNANVKTADIKVTAGEISVKPAFVCADNLKLTVNMGDIEFSLPQLDGFSIDYNIDVGKAGLEEILSVADILINSSDNPVTGDKGNISKGSAEADSSKISIAVGTGNIEFDND